MLRSASSRLYSYGRVATSKAQQQQQQQQRLFASSSSGSSPLAADSGALATHAHHTMNLALAVLTPVYFLTPESYSDGFFGKTFGVLLSANISAHSWIGLNYVATDYVPKVSKALLGPARMAIAGMSLITFLGMTRIAVGSPGGIKGCVKGLWNPPKKES